MTSRKTGLLLCLLAASAVVDAAAEEKRSGEGQRPLANGVYAVLGDAPARNDLGSFDVPHVVLFDAQKFAGVEKPVPGRFVAIGTGSYVPLVLAGPPRAEKDARGWTMLQLTLAKEHAKTLEDFTRAHLDERVAIVIDGEIVTIHKVRSVIQDGRAQITRCGDDACESLRLKLVK